MGSRRLILTTRYPQRPSIRRSRFSRTFSLALIIWIGSQWQARSGPLVADRGWSGRPGDVL